jgi:hypothetical protein
MHPAPALPPRRRRPSGPVMVARFLSTLVALAMALHAGPSSAHDASVHAGTGQGTAKTPDGSWRSTFIKKGNAKDAIIWQNGPYLADGLRRGRLIPTETKLTVVNGQVTGAKDPWVGFFRHHAGPLGSWAEGEGKGYTKYMTTGGNVTAPGYYSFWSVYVKGALGTSQGKRSFDSRARGLDPWMLTPGNFDGIPGPNFDLFFPVEISSANFGPGSGVKIHVSYQTAGAGDRDLLDVTISPLGVDVTGSSDPDVAFFVQDSLTQGCPEDTDTPATLSLIRSLIMSRIAGDSLTAPVSLGVQLSNQPIPTTPMGSPALATRAALADDDVLAQIHVDIEAFDNEADGGFMVTPWSGTAFPPGDPAFFCVPELTATVDLGFAPGGPMGPGGKNGDVALYGYDDNANVWSLLHTWDWTPGTVRSFTPTPGVDLYRLVDCGEDFAPYLHVGNLNFATQPHAPTPDVTLTMPDFVLGAVDHTDIPFNVTLGQGGGAPFPINLQPGLSMQSVPASIGANHWQYLPVQVNVQPDFSRPWLYVNNDPNQTLLQPTWVHLGLTRLSDPNGLIVNSLPIEIDFFQGASQRQFTSVAHYNPDGTITWPPVNLGLVSCQPYQVICRVPGTPEPGTALRRDDADGPASALTLPGYFTMNALIVSGNSFATVSAPPAPASDARLQLSAAAPNPFAGSTRLEYSNPVRERVSVVIFDLGGRAVRTLVDSEVEPGRHLVTWDGRDAAQHAVETGIYYARVESHGATAVRKVTLLH